MTGPRDSEPVRLVDDEPPATWPVVALAVVEAAVGLVAVALVVVVGGLTVGAVAGLGLPGAVVWLLVAFPAGFAARLAVEVPGLVARVWERHRTAVRRVQGPPETWAGPRWARLVERVTAWPERIGVRQ